MRPKGLTMAGGEGQLVTDTAGEEERGTPIDRP
jgi:hypothetical protein